MTYQEVLEQARGAMGPYCKACPVCNGLACRNTVPGPGAKGIGTGFIRNYQKWQELCVNMDTICENKPVDTTFTLFGRTVDLPVFAAPVGAMTLHYGDKYNDLAYNDILVAACAEAGIAAFTGDGTDPAVMEGAAAAIAKNGGCGVPTVKPWNLETIRQKMDLVKAADPFAIAMDIDAAGLPFLKNMTPPAGSKTVEELREIVAMAEKPFIVKGIMTVAGAKKALEAGAKGIVVSNHGGRVLDQCPSTAEVLPAIVDAVGGRMTILVDGGIRTGMDVFKALALGADARADRPALRHHGVRCRCRGRQDLCGKAEGRAGRHHGYVRRPLPGGHQPLHAVRVLSSAPASNHSAAPRMRGGASLFSYSRSARQARCQRSTTASCSGVWNQCSPASSTVRRQPFRAAKASTVSRSVRWSRAPYRMAVGVRHRRAGWVRTYRRYSQERVWPNVVGMRPSRASRSSLTPAQPIILRIRASMSTTGERNSAPARGASGYASRPNQAPRLEPKSPTRSHLPRSSARAHRSSGTTCQGTRAAASDSRSPWPGRSTLTVCHPASAAAAAKNAASALLPPWPWR